MNNNNGAGPSVAHLRWRGIRVGLAALTLGVAVLLSGCAATGTKSGDDAVAAEGEVPQALQRRALERWELLIAGDMDKAYEYLTPGYRQTRSLDAYKARARAAALRWDSIEWRSGECLAADSCEVTLLLSYSVRMPGAGDTPGIRQIEERWIRAGGDWYHLPER
jgi:hypothetical protein